MKCKRLHNVEINCGNTSIAGMQGENCWKIGDGGFGRWIPIADNRSLRTQDIKLWLARSGQVGVYE